MAHLYSATIEWSRGAARFADVIANSVRTNVLVEPKHGSS